MASDRLADYRLVAETEYSEWIAERLEVGQTDLRVEELVIHLPNDRRKVLEQQRSRYSLDLVAATTVEWETCHNLLYYLKVARYVRDQKIIRVGQAILDHERMRFCLTHNAAYAIDHAVLPKESKPNVVPSDDALKQYDLHLSQAIAQEGDLSKETRAELRLLQLVLGIPDNELPPSEKLQSDRRIDYIPLWRSLKRKDWKAANQKTYECLLRASGQKEREPQLIDIKRLPLRDLQTIDWLWREFSNSRFGFSVQLSIWRTVRPDLEQLGEELDWRRGQFWISEDFVDFSLDAAKGHLPILPQIGWWCWVGGMTSLLSKVGQFDQFKSQT